MTAAIFNHAFRLLLCGTLLISSAGCLGTAVTAPTDQGSDHVSLQIHLLAAPAVVRADRCSQGLADVTTYVPLWGVAVGILTLGIVVPEWTVYACAER